MKKRVIIIALIILGIVLCVAFVYFSKNKNRTNYLISGGEDLSRENIEAFKKVITPQGPYNFGNYKYYEENREE